AALRQPTHHHRFQEAPVVLAAFVTPNDPVIKDLKGQLSKHIGGLPTVTDEGALRFARAIYDYFRANITYSCPSGGLSQDGRIVQPGNYGRNVLKNGTGTFIDLAVTYASLAESAGLSAGVVLKPNHAYAVVVLPVSRRVLAVETTGCVEGTLERSLPFGLAL